jgi:SAM-dependent methyltransferase
MTNTLTIGDPTYWEERYKFEISKMLRFKLFDWYAPFDVLYPMVENILDRSMIHKVLVVGVGRSNIIDTLYQRGFRDITAIDISPTIVNEMQKFHAKLTGVEFIVMDMREMTRLANGLFTLIIDKGGLDALFCGEDFKTSSQRAIQEIHRVLVNNGLFVSFSHAPFLARVPYMRVADFSIEATPVVGGGESLSMFSLLKTTTRELLDRRVVGGEASQPAKRSAFVSTLDAKMNKASTTRSAGNTGLMTVTASVDVLADLVEETEGMDS